MKWTPVKDLNTFLEWCINVVGRNAESASGHFWHAGLRIEEIWCHYYVCSWVLPVFLVKTNTRHIIWLIIWAMVMLSFSSSLLGPENWDLFLIRTRCTQCLLEFSACLHEHLVFVPPPPSQRVWPTIDAQVAVVSGPSPGIKVVGNCAKFMNKVPVPDAILKGKNYPKAKISTLETTWWENTHILLSRRRMR